MSVAGKVSGLAGAAQIWPDQGGSPMYTEFLKDSTTANFLEGTPIEIHVTGLCTAITTSSTKFYGWSNEQTFSDLPSVFSRYPIRTAPVSGRQRFQCAPAVLSNRVAGWAMKVGRTAKVGDQVGISITNNADGYGVFYLDDQATNKLFQVISITPDDQDTANMPYCIAGGRVDVMVIASVSQYIAGNATATSP